MVARGGFLSCLPAEEKMQGSLGQLLPSGSVPIYFGQGKLERVDWFTLSSFLPEELSFKILETICIGLIIVWPQGELK